MTSYRYLGIEVDEALGWQSHLDTICKKVSAGIGALRGAACKDRAKLEIGPKITTFETLSE